jgi:DNA mismatch repair protein MutL
VNRIRLLPEQVANQIAAGEVVERPASVVKELVENSLDAESTRIQVEIGAGGRSLIRVTDDGLGMSRDDALMCLERHATSKLRRAEDLAAIATMGFRGEAIPSIASVSRFTLTTRERQSEALEATQVIIHGGKILEVKAAAFPSGTSVEVRQLFFNLPARRKFLRSEETERSHIQQYLTLAALAWPSVAFTLTIDGRVSWQCSSVQSASGPEALRERLRQVLGADVPLLPVDFTAQMEEARDLDALASSPNGPDGARPTTPFRVWGFIGAPGVSRSTREEQFLFVNRRPVENRGLNFALLEGYHTALMKGRYPVCCLLVELDPAAVDVNVHPQKREVRFREEAAVRRLVGRAVREVLLQFHSQSADPAASASNASPDSPALALALNETPVVEAAPPAAQQTTLGFAAADPAPVSRLVPTPPVTSVGTAGARFPAHPQVAPFSPASAGSVPKMVQPAVSSAPLSPIRPAVPGPGSGPIPLLQVPMRLVGVVGRLYVVLESDRGMVLLDQHAAHERILFEQMIARLEAKGDAASQRLLLPETVELPPRDAVFLREHLDTLSRLGVGLREFGDRTFLLDALPPFVKAGQPRQFVLELVDALKAAGTGVNSVRLGEDVIAKTVCRHAVKANDPLAGRELERLIDDLRRCTMPYTCPHGRPTLIEMGWRELEKKFGRTG